MSDKHKKSTFRIYAEYIPFWMLYKLLEKMPLKRGYRFAEKLTALLYLIDQKHAKRTRAHILHAGMAKTPEEADRMARRSFAEFAKLLVEIVKMPQLYSKDKLSVEGPEETLNRILPERNPEGPRNTILVTAHLGNWEVAGEAYSEYIQTPMTSLMRGFSNPLIGKLILGHRAGTLHKLADKTLGIRPLLKALLKGETGTLLIDQHAAGSEGVVCEFFGHPARVHMTPALLHMKLGIPVMPELTVRMPGEDFRFKFVVGDLIYYKPTGDKQKDIQKLTQIIISGLEKLIRQYPEQWLWAPRHWLDIDRRQAALYQNWKPEEETLPESDTKKEPSL